ncbi:SpoIIE family protein phosphatase [Flammeovirga yaeyamensis]|uniref:SpoIIE family protein phosphatase n=1 Tax=Flammeovirga yaeyamensis TaxID=367791 RepID=A0AAX1N6Z6_9BACT|nr:PP2C family protein-serine/threonine phosphatase [Flammeovirga yaeyamensis]MBB3697926.1 sigma-B regulation protein RsbU (phosphoserine phosphatase) [Flammeovirga yaeyamensis]NMF35719.1 PP2C family protein-serine/threonine phosphatase [Flammeovirga yaeyamensis]QWG03328.1 SpoIIE family protein phosphatase [Flammeovirga yaeyamensis]
MANNMQKRLMLKEMQLESLFETISAINANRSEEDLYTIYKLTLSSNPSITNLILYVIDDDDQGFSRFVNYGTHDDQLTSIFPPQFEVYDVSSKLEGDKPEGYEPFDTIIPIKHKNDVLAYALVGSTKDRDDFKDQGFTEALTNIILVAIENKKLARKEEVQKEMKKQLEIASHVQHMLFPKKLPYGNDVPVSVHASYMPHHSIGGDYYDYVPLSDTKFLMSIADVSGKGAPAALLMSNFQGTIRAMARRGTDLEHIVHEANTQILESAEGESFITAFFMEFDTTTRTLRYINAGHNPPFMYRNEKFERLEVGTTILGSFSQLPFLEIGEIDNLHQFFVFGFTDGFTETYNDEDEELGDEKLQEFLESNINFAQKEMHENLISLLNTFKGHQAYADDITLLSCKIDLEKLK